MPPSTAIRKQCDLPCLVKHFFEFRGNTDASPFEFISSLNVMHLLKKGCQGFLAIVWDVSVEATLIMQILLVNEFLDVFSDELLGMPLDREIEFYIDIVYDAQLELKELKKQLQELLNKGFIHASTSSWGCSSAICEEEG